MVNCDELTKVLTVKDVRGMGIIQEINRLVLHPAGLHMELSHSDLTGEESPVICCSLYDGRDHDGGVVFPKKPSYKIRDRISEMTRRNSVTRLLEMGRVIQPLDVAESLNDLPVAN